MLPLQGRDELVLRPTDISAVTDSFYSPFIAETEVHCQIFKSTNTTKLFQVDRCHNNGQYPPKLSV